MEQLPRIRPFQESLPSHPDQVILEFSNSFFEGEEGKRVHPPNLNVAFLWKGGGKI